MRWMSIVLAAVLVLSVVQADDWPQWLGPQRDGEWRETGILEKFPAGGPKVRWEAPVGQGYAGPAVASGRVYLCDFLPEGKGAGSSVRGVRGTERTLCFDQKTGREIWKSDYPVDYRIQYAAGPRCTPTVDGDRVYTLGAMGQLNCHDAATGKALWSKDFVKDYQARINIWGFSAHPLVDGERLICLVGGSGERLVVAFDKKTGKELWASQALQSDAGYSPPVIYDLAGRRTLVIWHGRGCVGLDPETGKRFWHHPWDVQRALTAPMARKLDGDRVFLTAFYEGPVMLRIGSESTPAIVWKGKGKNEHYEQSDGIHSIMPTSVVKDGHIYGVSSYGELLCQNADSGATLWKTRQPTVGSKTDEGKPVRWGNAFLTPNGDRYFLFNERGELLIARLSPQGYEEIDRTPILKPTNRLPGRPVVWSHPAYADRCAFIRNDEKLVCVDLAK